MQQKRYTFGSDVRPKPTVQIFMKTILFLRDSTLNLRSIGLASSIVVAFTIAEDLYRHESANLKPTEKFHATFFPGSNVISSFCEHFQQIEVFTEQFGIVFHKLELSVTVIM